MSFSTSFLLKTLSRNCKRISPLTSVLSSKGPDPYQGRQYATEAMAPTLTPEQIAVVKSTAPVLKEHGVTITTLFYRNMINAHPELHNVFSTTSQTTGAQPRALAASVLAYATYIDDLPKLTHAVERIAQKHASLYIKPEQYDIVGRYLMEAIGQVLGDAATPQIVDAWQNAYAVLANVFIGREKQLYEEHTNWNGWRKFRIARKEPEAERITSFYLEPADGTALPAYLPGQYISLQVFVKSLGYLQSRQYSMSDAPQKDGKYYRISVKREHDDTADIDGLISNMLHKEFNVGDEVELSHPQGEFFLNPADTTKQTSPVVLISAGVGATPLLSILNSLAKPDTTNRPVSWIHTSRTRAQMPFADEVDKIKQESKGRITTRIVLREAGEYGAATAKRMDLLDLDREKELYVADPQAEYYVCGPEDFMKEVRRTLESLGVQRDRVFLELFATGDVSDD